MSSRRNHNSEDRELEREIDSSLKTSSYLDGVYDAIMSGNKDLARANVPNYGSGISNNMRLGNESGGESMNMDSVFAAAANTLGDDETALAMEQAYPTREGERTFKSAPSRNSPTPRQSTQGQAAGPSITANQYRACRQYPNVVEFLGTEQGAKVANVITEQINQLLAERIQENTKLVNEYADICVAKKQYLNHFFKGDGWACRVTASGPFTGNEAFFYKDDDDKSFILRRFGSRYQDVTSDFNIVHDFRTVETENEES